MSILVDDNPALGYSLFMVNNKAARRYVVMSVPGSDDGIVPTAWFVVDLKSHRCVGGERESFDAARAAAREMNRG